MIKKFCVSDLKPFRYLIEVYDTERQKLKYVISTGKIIKLDYNLNPKSNNIIQVFDDLNSALKEYQK